MSRERVLIADDEPDIRRLVSTFLQKRGYQVTTAANGSEALAAARNEPPDILITDVTMPVLDGLGLARQLRKDPRTTHVPIIMLSARKQVDDVLAGYSEGVDEYVAKPVDMAVLAAKVQTLLRRDQKPPTNTSPVRADE